MRQNVTELDQEKRVQVPGLPEFLAEAGSEASDAESPHFEDVTGDGAIRGAPSEAGIAPIEEEEEEEKNSHAHFKQKRKDSPSPKPRKKQVVKKSRQHATRPLQLQRVSW